MDAVGTTQKMLGKRNGHRKQRVCWDTPHLTASVGKSLLSWAVQTAWPLISPCPSPSLHRGGRALFPRLLLPAGRAGRNTEEPKGRSKAHAAFTKHIQSARPKRLFTVWLTCKTLTTVKQPGEGGWRGASARLVPPAPAQRRLQPCRSGAAAQKSTV